MLTRGQAAGFMNPTRRPACRTQEKKRLPLAFKHHPSPRTGERGLVRGLHLQAYPTHPFCYWFASAAPSTHSDPQTSCHHGEDSCDLGCVAFFSSLAPASTRIQVAHLNDAVRHHQHTQEPRRLHRVLHVSVHGEIDSGMLRWVRGLSRILKSLQCRMYPIFQMPPR